MVEKTRPNSGSDNDNEPEITVDTELPVPIDPTVLALSPIETSSVAVPIEVQPQQILQQANAGNEEPMAIPAAAASPVLAATAVNDSNTSTEVSVIAPATLAAGYTFSAQVDGIDFIVEVPQGGVTQGQQFTVPYPTRPSATATSGEIIATASGPPRPPPPEAPQGHWRNGVCDSCCQSCCSALWWQALFLPPILFGQIAQRLHLNPIGLRSTSRGHYRNTCIIISIVFLVAVMLALAQVVQYVVWAFFIFLWVVFMNTRYAYRKHYGIGISCGCCGCFDGRVDDLFCTAVCTMCTGMQMARHTHPPDRYRYECCTRTGLSSTAPDPDRLPV